MQATATTATTVPLLGARRRWTAVMLSALALAVVVAVFEVSDLDLRVQDRLFDFDAGRWVVDANAPAGRLWFYNGPKALVWIAGLSALALWAGPPRWRERFGVSRRGLAIAVLTIATVPALAGAGKAVTNVFCPYEIERYGGTQAYRKTFERYDPGERPEARGRGYPAGHASGGFALIGLAWLRRSARWQRGMMALGLALGWWMGGYQMLKGAHYLSHTIVTMLLAITVALFWHALLRDAPARARDDVSAK